MTRRIGVLVEVGTTGVQATSAAYVLIDALRFANVLAVANNRDFGKHMINDTEYVTHFILYPPQGVDAKVWANHIVQNIQSFEGGGTRLQARIIDLGCSCR